MITEVLSILTGVSRLLPCHRSASLTARVCGGSPQVRSTPVANTSTVNVQLISVLYHGLLDSKDMIFYMLLFMYDLVQKILLISFSNLVLL